MKTVGIICEYNPFHLGHRKQLNIIREQFGDDCAIVCLMSGSYVQRGEPAVFDKALRAQAAVCCGADLVVEMPTTVSLSSAEGFAAGSVRILSQLCDTLCFGTESESAASLMQTAELLLSPAFSGHLKQALADGCSFPKARANALASMGAETGGILLPNNLLGLEYCKAILQQNSPISPFVIHRNGSYHNTVPDDQNPSATALRLAIERNEDISKYLPKEAAMCFENASIHNLKSGEQAMLYRLKTMTETDFSNLPFGSEGLWRKLMHSAEQYDTVSEILWNVKSKRYTFTRISRMTLCAYLGITQQIMDSPVPYCRILGFSSQGRKILRELSNRDGLKNIGQKTKHPYEQLENKWDALYSLFLVHPETTKNEKNRNIFCKP